MAIDRFNITHITCKTISVFDCRKLYDTLIILNLIDIYKGFVYLYITKQPVYGTVPRAYNETLSVFPSYKTRVVSGSQPKRS